jgi:hypothetical protein
MEPAFLAGSVGRESLIVQGECQAGEKYPKSLLWIHLGIIFKATTPETFFEIPPKSANLAVF